MAKVLSDYWQQGLPQKVPDDAKLILREYGWGVTEGQIKKVVNLCSLKPDYAPLEFGKPVVCTLSGTDGEFTGSGAFPLHALARATATYLRERKVYKRNIEKGVA